jgi:hypothetical protein
LIGSAEEVLKVLEAASIHEADKRGKVEDIIGKQTDERFAVLVYLSKKIIGFELTINDIQDVGFLFIQFIFIRFVCLGLRFDNVDADGQDKSKLRPVDVDAHWIQRALTRIYEPIAAEEKVREVMQILQVCFLNKIYFNCVCMFRIQRMLVDVTMLSFICSALTIIFWSKCCVTITRWSTIAQS